MEISGDCSKVLLLQVTELCHTLFWKYNCVTSKLEISDQVALFFGQKASQVSEAEKQAYFSRYIDAIRPKEREKFKNITSGLFPENEGFYRYILNLRDGNYHHRCKYNRLNGNGQDLIIGTIIDETNSISAQNMFSEKESVFEHITTHSNIGIFSWKPYSGEHYVSPQWYHNFGLSLIIPLKDAMHIWPEYIHPEDYARVKEKTQEIREGKNKYMDVTFRISLDKAIHWVRYTAIIKNFNKREEDVQIIGMNQDLTILKKQEERNIKILEALPDFIFIFDKHFFIRDILKSRHVNLLHPIEQLMGADGRTIFSPEVSALYLETIQRCLSEQAFQEIEYPLDVENGRYYFQARIVPFEENTVMALIHDITEKVSQTQELIDAKQKAEEADRMKSAFLANMSHEIRTPLNAIIGFSEILPLTDDPTEKKTYQEIIRTNSSLLLQLINDILDLSRIESGKTEIILQETEMSSLIKEVEQVYRLKINNEVGLRIEHPDKDIWVQTDHSRVTQVLFNFMSNAIKNTQHGTITLSLSPEEKGVRLSVTDTGYGIPADKLNLIFERFVKINDFIQGTGLGLFICRTIAKKLGGCISVTSELGKGSKFSLFLPYAPGKVE